MYARNPYRTRRVVGRCFAYGCGIGLLGSVAGTVLADDAADLGRGFDFTAAPQVIINAEFEEGDGANEAKGWRVEPSELVRRVDQGGEEGWALRLERRDGASGRATQELDVGAFQGEKLYLHFRARVEGGVVPYFHVESLDGEKGEVATGGRIEPTATLAEYHRFGYWYDFRYGWPVNDHLPALYHDDWQPVGGVFTVPTGVQRVRITIEPRPAKYGLIERREVLPRQGAVVIDAVRVAPIDPVWEPTSTSLAEQWAADALEPKDFFFLSYLYNEALIRNTAAEAALWQAVTRLRYAQRLGLETGPFGERAARLADAIDAVNRELAGLRTYYEQHTDAMLDRLDLTAIQAAYPLSKDGGFGASDTQASRDMHLSVYIESLVREGYALEHPLVSQLHTRLNEAEAGVRRLMDDLAASIRAAAPMVIGAAPLPPMTTPDRGLLPADGHAPRILYVTGNTNFPYRVYKDLGVDLVSINYYNDITEKGFDEHPSAARILGELGLRQYSSLFSPVHYQFAVTNDFMAEHADGLEEVLRYDRNRNSPFVTRHRKTSRKQNIPQPIDTFTMDPELRYYVPINALSPTGRALIDARLETIASHAIQPDNKPVLAALELSAEAVSLVTPGEDPWTKAAFAEFLRDRFGHIANLNSLFGATYASFEEVAQQDPASRPLLERVRLARLVRAFNALADAEIYRQLRAKLAQFRPDLPVIHRNNDLYFSDYAPRRVALKDDYISYHAGYDRAYGYYLGRYLDKDHLINEDVLAAPTGLRSRDTIPIARAKFLRTGWRFAAWGTKTICLWRMYREPLLVSAASEASRYTLINENYAVLPWLKALTSRFAAVLDGEVRPPDTAILQLEQQGHTAWYLPSVYGVTEFLRRRHVDYAYVFEEAMAADEGSLDAYRLIIVPPSLFVNEAMQQRLLAWVDAGGVLVTFGPMGLYDEHVRPSGRFLQRVFGPASYHLVGTAETLRAYEGYWLPRFERPRHVRRVRIDGDVPREDGQGLFEKLYNDPKALIRFTAAEGEHDAGHWLYVADHGEGRVIYVPREFLPNSAAEALWEQIKAVAGELASATTDDPGVSVMLRQPLGGASDGPWYLLVQNENEWAGPGEVEVSVRGAYSAVWDVSAETAMPVPASVESGRTQFGVHLYPGQINIFQLHR